MTEVSAVNILLLVLSYPFVKFPQAVVGLLRIKLTGFTLQCSVLKASIVSVGLSLCCWITEVGHLKRHLSQV